jgi:hypothetical protein
MHNARKRVGTMLSCLTICAMSFSLSQASDQDLVQESFSDGIIAPWEIYNNINQYGTVAINENNGVLSIKLSGGNASFKGAGIYQNFQPAKNFSISVTIRSDFTGTVGNQRAWLFFSDSLGVGYGLGLGRDGSVTSKGQVCRGNIGCTNPTGTYVRGESIRYNIIKANDTVYIYQDGTLILSEQSVAFDLAQIQLGGTIANNSPLYTSTFDDVVIISGN